MRLRVLQSGILGLFCVTLAIRNAPALQPPVPSDSIAATVNGESITLEEIDAVLEATLRGATLTKAQHRELRRAILEDLIDEKLLRQFLNKQVPKVDSAELEAQMAALKANLIKENDTLEDFLKRSHRSEVQLRDEWKARLQLAQYVRELASDEKLRAYHAAHRDHFDKVQVRASHILIRAGGQSSPVDRAAAKEKLQRIREQIVKGHLSFGAAARKYSQCSTALKNGDMGFLARRGLPEDEPLARTAFALRVGEVSSVIESDRGVHLLTVTERKPGKPTAIENCVLEVLDAFAEDTRIDLVQKLRKEGKVEVRLR
jgi:peptidyl-prolyl cis-trans isomerase C